MASLAQRLRDKNRLGGTFFFRCNQQSHGIADARALFTTLALQLGINVPELRPTISLAVEQDPTILARSKDLQLRRLIIEPVQNLRGASWTFLIDGLDECGGDGGQEEVLRLIGEFIPPCTPLQFVIASRPEMQIRRAFKQPAWRGAYRAHNLLPARRDVETYLHSSFARIRQDWSHIKDVEFPDPWPSVDDMEHLVTESSGYFIYASTVVKYVGDIRASCRPTELLNIIINGSNSNSRHAPFSVLDKLYLDILRATPLPRHERLVDVLRVVCYFDMTPRQIESILQIQKGDVAIALSGFHSLIHWPEPDSHPEGTVVTWHATFPDFLCDEARSAEFYVGRPDGLQRLACLVTEELGYRYQDTDKNRTDLFGFDYDTMTSLGYLLSKIEVDSDEIGRRLADMNRDFILCLLRWSHTEPGPLLDWVEQHAQGLYNQWQNYKAMAMYPTSTYGTNQPPSSLVEELITQIVECPTILRILKSTLLLHDLEIVSTRFVLGISWDNDLELGLSLHDAMTRLLPFIDIAEKHELDWRRLIRKVLDRMVQRDTWMAETSWELAVGCMKLRQSIDTGVVPNVWTDDIQDYGRFVRGCPPDPRLLAMLREFEPPEYGEDAESRQDHECYDILKWLETFANPPQDEHDRWTRLFLAECQRLALLRLRPVNDYEERWNQWQARLDLSKTWIYREERWWWDSERRDIRMRS